MKTILFNNGLLLSAIFIIILILIAWRVKIWGKKQMLHMRDYERKYGIVDHVIDNYHVCELNYDYILILIDTLRKHPGRSDEQLSVLDDNFRIKYSEVRDKRKKEQYS